MAIVILKDVAVTRVNGRGNGLQVTETSTNGEKTYATRFTVWFDQPSGLVVGDVVNLSGFLSAKVGEPWTGNDGQQRHSVELSLNSPRIVAGGAPDGGNSGSTDLSGTDTGSSVPEPVQEPWAKDAETPF